MKIEERTAQSKKRGDKRWNETIEINGVGVSNQSINLLLQRLKGEHASQHLNINKETGFVGHEVRQNKTKQNKGKRWYRLFK